ncbi:NAD-dependent epimerase/dehydratase family protein [Candidatus Micrarchaeota archaeon]|nr:NAD-dependent epimerase/dehydratase family protein [Candidatus Micrarchaeota archaeon]
MIPTMERILLSGGAGKLGRVLVPALLARGYALTLLVRDAGSAREKLGFLPAKNFQLLQADLSRQEGVAAAINRAGTQDLAINAAGSVDYSAGADAMMEGNGKTAGNFAGISRALGVRRLVHVSSTSVYGKVAYGPIDETAPTNPAGAYGKSKLEAENAVGKSGLETVILLRPCAIYGSTFWSQYEKFAVDLIEGKARLIGDGNNRVALVHASDVASAVVLALGKRNTSGAYNIASGEQVTQKGLYEIASRIMGVPAPAKSAPKQLAYLAASVDGLRARFISGRRTIFPEEISAIAEDRAFSIEKARRELEWEPKVKMEKGMAEMLAARGKKWQRA